MLRKLRLMRPAVFVVTIVLALSQAADAQREEGRRGRGGPEERRFGGGFGASAVRLASIDEVQNALKLSDEQKSKIEKLNDQFRDDLRKLLQESGDPEEMQKLNKDASTELKEVLDDEQEKRLKGISIQVMGAAAVVVDPELAKELNVTDEQKTRLQEAQRSNREAMGAAWRELRDLSEDQRRAKALELRTEADKKFLAELTPEQQDQLNALKGEKVDIDMSQLRGPGRGGFEGRRGRGRNEGGRDERGERDRKSSDGDSELESN